jgi:hypothetical protein
LTSSLVALVAEALPVADPSLLLAGSVSWARTSEVSAVKTIRSTKNFVSERMYFFSRMICKTGLFLSAYGRQRKAFFVSGNETIRLRVACFVRSIKRKISEQFRMNTHSFYECASGLKSGPLQSAGFITQKYWMSRKSFFDAADITK